jgi:hypothetical protein
VNVRQHRYPPTDYSRTPAHRPVSTSTHRATRHPVGRPARDDHPRPYRACRRSRRAINGRWTDQTRQTRRPIPEPETPRARCQLLVAKHGHDHGPTLGPLAARTPDGPATPTKPLATPSPHVATTAIRDAERVGRTVGPAVRLVGGWHHPQTSGVSSQGLRCRRRPPHDRPGATQLGMTKGGRFMSLHARHRTPHDPPSCQSECEVSMRQWLRRIVPALLTLGVFLLAWRVTPSSWLQRHWLPSAAAILILCIAVFPKWLAPPRSAASLAHITNEMERIRLEDEGRKLQNDVRTALLQGVAGAAVIAGIVVTWQQLQTDREQARRELALASQGQVADRFAHAVDQLATKDNLDKQLGGIYGLERIGQQASERLKEGDARDQGDDRQAAEDRLQVFDILAVYVREHSHLSPTGRSSAPLLQERQADVQAAMSALGRRVPLPTDPALDLGGSLLRGARLYGAELTRADLGGADLRGADLRGAHLEQAMLCGADLQSARLGGAHLEGAHASNETTWPRAFNWRAAGVVIAACGP